MIFHIPHSSTIIPENIRNHFELNDDQLTNEIKHMTDWFTSELFGMAVDHLGVRVEFPISRLVVDPERFFVDEEEIMSNVGMGAVYEKTFSGQNLRKKGYAAGIYKQELLDLYYHPHHNELTNITDEYLFKDGKAIIIDCHSFPSIALPYELDKTDSRPDICIGTDSYHTPDALKENLYKAFTELNYDVKVNTPFSGSLVPLKHYKKNLSVNSIMIEVNRSIYMDEEKLSLKDDFGKVQHDICSAIKNMLITPN